MNKNWKVILRENIRDFKTLFTFLELSETQVNQLDLDPHFPLNIPLRLAKKIPKGCIEGPIFKQFIPSIEEKTSPAHFNLDPVGDLNAQKTPCLLKKYASRVLLLPTQVCAMHCRYCFRQHFDYQKSPQHALIEELKFIEKDESISEVILSGGDPLSLSDRSLEDLIRRLNSIAHLKRLRFHSRFPIGIPERIDENFLHVLSLSRLQIYFVIHSNHAIELDDDVITALNKMKVPLLNQSVLLKGVNDTPSSLTALCQRCIDHGILPYYLHQLDQVQGAAHFEVPVEQGISLIHKLEESLSGYGVPRYVHEREGDAHKFRIT